MSFDPNGTGQRDLGIFSLPFSEKDSKLVLIPVPWEVTTSFGNGCSDGPDAILEASKQLDLCDALYGQFYQNGIFQRATDQNWMETNRKLKKAAIKIKDKLEKGEELSSKDLKKQQQINEASQELNQWLYEQSRELIESGKFCGVIGGDHSSPLGLIRALSEKHPQMSILHVDAHHDLRVAFQGYQYSHASIMDNVLKETNIQSLVQVGIRDFSPSEEQEAKDNPKIHCFYDSQVSWELATGKSWLELCEQMIAKLTDEVYISFDIDGLLPDLCPGTGTPVPGGVSFAQMEALLYALSKSGKKIVGFDLCEVSPETDDYSNSWDANVGARVLFKLAGALLNSQIPN